MKALIVMILLSSLMEGQQPALEQDKSYSILANVDAVHHFYPKGGGVVSVMSIDSGAVNNPLTIYLVVTQGDGPDAVAKIWNLGLRCAKISRVKLLPSEREVMINTSVDIEERDSGKMTNQNTAHSVSWESVSALVGGNGNPALPPSVKDVEKKSARSVPGSAN